MNKWTFWNDEEVFLSGMMRRFRATRKRWKKNRIIVFFLAEVFA